jgi:hypothetical protein
MYVAPSDILISPNLDGKSGYSFIEASYDVTIADKLKSGKDNELQTVSDIQEILMALVAELGSHPYYVDNQMKLVGDVNLVTTLEQDDAIVSKVTAEITLRYPFKYQYCNQPVDNIPFYPSITTDIFTSVTQSICTIIEDCPVILTIDLTLINLQDQIDNIVSDKAYIGYFDFSSQSITSITQSNTWYKLNTDTQSVFSRNGLTHSNNRITNTSDSKIVKVEAISSLQASNNKEIHMAFFKNDTLLPCTEQSINTGSANRITALPIHCIAELETNDYIEVWVKNATSASNVTIDNINVIVTEL